VCLPLQTKVLQHSDELERKGLTGQKLLDAVEQYRQELLSDLNS
jgi:hypothetical protein